mgnify:CR=1 FL=1
MLDINTIEQLDKIATPFYYYDLDLLRQTLHTIQTHAPENNFRVHYAMKACATPKVVQQIANAQLGADCVSGGEIKAALQAGIPAEKIVFAGVAKADWEIKLALQKDIFCFYQQKVQISTVSPMILSTCRLLKGITGIQHFT